MPPNWQDKPNLKELVDIQTRWEPIPRGDGWYEIGTVLDTFADMSVPGLAVWWHRETDQVKVQRPPKRERPPDPKPWQPAHNPGIR